MKLWGMIVLMLISGGASCSEAPVYDRSGLHGVGHPAGGYILGDPPDYEDMVWRRIAEAGATSVRQAASWREIEAERGKYDWSQVEGTLKYCRKYPQIRPYLLVVNTPGWAREDGKPSHLPPVPSAIPDWKRFCTALAQRYKGFVNHYEIWNEQNGFGWEVPPYNQFDKYLPILEAAYDGLKEGNPECVVSLGGLDDAAGHSPIFTKGCYDLRFRDYGGKKMWDAFADHPYGDAESMMAKLRAIKGIAAGYGDGNLEIWLTEYGFHAGDMTLQEQADALTKYMTAIITDPELRYVTETNYLCVADFEQRVRGFGLCDVNLRPRPAFYAYQRLPRPGKIVISDIRAEPLSATSVRISWRTDTDARGQVDVAGKTYRQDAPRRDHSVQLDNLRPFTSYSYKIRCSAQGFPDAETLDYEFTTLASSGLRNADFEEGFEVQIAKHWTCVGESLCWDSARLDGRFALAHSGKHAQAIVAVGKWGGKLDDCAIAQAAAEVGKTCTFSAWTRAESEHEKPSIGRRVGIDPTGNTDPSAATVVWSDYNNATGKWERQTVTAKAQAKVITVFVEAKGEKTGPGRDIFYVDDAELRVGGR